MFSLNVEKELRDYLLSISLTVADGETLVIIGENGAGKSTLLNMTAGLLHPDRGSVTLSGRKLFDSAEGICLPPEERKTGYVLQNYALFPHMTVRENVAYGLLSRGVKTGNANQRADAMLGKMGISSFADVFPTALSGGQRQRVALARALVTDPDILLLDEPLAALDVRTKNTMRGELRECIRAAGIPAVIVTHALKDALELGDRIAVIEDGKIVADGTPDEILTDENGFASHFFCGCVTAGKGRAGEQR